jgi:hypothetical protein
VIRLSFLLGREVIIFWIDKKVIWYKDRKQTKIQVIPESEDLAKLKKNPHLTKAFTLRGKDKIEYDNARTDEEIAVIIKRDCRNMMMRLLKEEKSE